MSELDYRQLAVIAADIASQSGQAYGEVYAALMEATVLVDRLRADLATARRAIATALAEHPKVHPGFDPGSEDCGYCEVLWPCPTVRALSAGGGGPHEGGSGE